MVIFNVLQVYMNNFLLIFQLDWQSLVNKTLKLKTERKSLAKYREKKKKIKTRMLIIYDIIFIIHGW